MTGALVVVAYDRQWPQQFQHVAAELRTALREVSILAIEHVGSTAVPGLAAKPILDIDVVVADEQVAPAIAALEAVGYVHLGDMGIPDRYGMREPGGVRRNTYVTVAGCLSLRNHLAVRDTLRVRDDLRDEYAAVKLALAARTDDIDEYVDGKTDMVLRILHEAGVAQDEMDEVESLNRVET
jgi:GrpB-like predicted nucleotidyltransferase (UPF0157 family)